MKGNNEYIGHEQNKMIFLLHWFNHFQNEQLLMCSVCVLSYRDFPTVQEALCERNRWLKLWLQDRLKVCTKQSGKLSEGVPP